MSKRVLVSFGVLLVLVAALVVFSFPAVFAELTPNGANFTAGTPEATPTNYTPGNTVAYAGNITGLTVFAYASTQAWQGYFGNVTGTIQLADAQSRVMYNWSLGSPQGEIYASTNSSIIWLNVECFNHTAEGTLADDLAQVGNTSLFGYNMSQIEDRFNVTWDDVDGLNETFYLKGAGGHETFFTATKRFDEGECMSTRVFDNTGIGTDGNFEEVLLYEPASTSLIFTSLLEEDTLGFDNAAHDFEMLVLENGHGTDTSTTMYYFFVEIQ